MRFQTVSLFTILFLLGATQLAEASGPKRQNDDVMQKETTQFTEEKSPEQKNDLVKLDVNRPNSQEDRPRQANRAQNNSRNGNETQRRSRRPIAPKETTQSAKTKPPKPKNDDVKIDVATQSADAKSKTLEIKPAKQEGGRDNSQGRRPHSGQANEAQKSSRNGTGRQRPHKIPDRRKEATQLPEAKTITVESAKQEETTEVAKTKPSKHGNDQIGQDLENQKLQKVQADSGQEKGAQKDSRNGSGRQRTSKKPNHIGPKASLRTTEDPWPHMSFPERKIPEVNWNDFYILLGICIVGFALAVALLGLRVRAYIKDCRLERKEQSSEDTTSHTSGDGGIDRVATQASTTPYKPFRIPARDIRFQGPLKLRPSFDGDQSHRYNNNTSSNSPPPEDYTFDPNLNEAAEIGSGVEIIEEHSTPSSQMSTVYGTSIMQTGYNSTMSRANEQSSFASSIRTSSIMERFKKKKNQKNTKAIPGLKPVPKEKARKGGKLRRKLSV